MGESFDAEYFEAIRAAQIVAKMDAETIVANIKNAFEEEYGEDLVSEAIEIGFDGIRNSQTEAIDESESEQESEQENESEEWLWKWTAPCWNKKCTMRWIMCGH